MLVKNRDKLQESESFILTLQKDRPTAENIQRRINVKKILDLSEMVNKPYDKVSIELKDGYNIEELKEALKEEGKTQVKIIINKNDKKIAFELEKSRKFDLSTFNQVKNKEYVKKISF